MASQSLPAPIPIRRDLEEQLTQVARDLIGVHSTSGAQDDPGLIFPQCRGGDDLRVCEQEAKVLFLHHILSSSRYRVAVEKPTSKDYGFSGTGRRSAQTDVALYDRGHDTQALIEFKADNRDTGICKDLEKLICEEELGAWFHTLAAADRGTLPSLARKFKTSFADLSYFLDDAQPHDCLFAFCIVRNRVFLSRWLPLGGPGALDTLQDAFNTLALDEPSWRPQLLSGTTRTNDLPDVIAEPSECAGT
jgi:hypothetical protein